MDQRRTTIGQNRRKKCHGNRRLRQFKRRCRKRGMNEQAIQEAIEQWKCLKQQKLNNPSITETTTTTNVENPTTTIRKINKRKRLPTSTSLRSISTRPATTKKIKITKKKQLKNNSTNTNYRLPLYLRKAPNLLVQGLRLQLKMELKQKREQKFLYHRLKLFDQQQRLDIHRNLWQLYMILGSEEHIWPVSFSLFFFC